MGGKLSKSITRYQMEYYQSIYSKQSATKWAVSLSKVLLNILHGLFMTRNTFVHSNFQGVLSLNTFSQLHKYIKAQLDLVKEGLPKEDDYLLIETWESLSYQPIAEQQAWLCTISLSSYNKNKQIPSKSPCWPDPPPRATSVPITRPKFKRRHHKYNRISKR